MFTSATWSTIVFPNITKSGPQGRIALVIKAVNKMKRKQEAEAAPAGPSAQEALLAEIRDLLKK